MSTERFASPIDRLASLSEEERKIGPFQLDHQLGRGGFAPVWLAREVYGATELRTVAIKLFAAGVEERTSLATRGSTARETERIIEEARAICQVEHPNVVRFYSICHDPGSRLVGLVMEYLSGTALDKHLRQLEDLGAKMGLDELLSVGVAIASALSAVHQVGLVHRDVKPANVIESAGVHKLIDFGVARSERRNAGTERAARTVLLDDVPIEVGASIDGEGLTEAALPLTGTLGYVDPHVFASGAAATPSSDLYALGAMLFECATGRVPAALAAQAEGSPGLKFEVLDGHARPPSLSTVAPHLPPRFAKMVDALLDPSPGGRPRSAESVAWELEAIRREIGGRERPLPPEDVGPFRGLGRFEPSDRDVYFGRAVEIAACLEIARSRGLLALVGPSGSGKSSLARAGVLPAIVDGGLGKWPKSWDTAVVVPGADAQGAIVAALSPFVEDAAKRTPESLASALGERVQSSGRGMCLLVDQLEELVTVSAPGGRDFVARLLAQLGSQPIPGVRSIVAARRDLLDPLLALGELGRALTKGTLLVSPMTDATWGEVLDQALSAYGYELEDESLRAELLRQLTGTASAMPLVEFALTKLWERRDRATKVIPRSALHAIGGIGGALQAHADATLEGQGTAGEETARAVLLAMTTPQGTRRAVARKVVESLTGGAPEVLARLEGARLVVQEGEGLTLAHETLLTQWSRLESWIAEAREDRLLSEAIERDAEEWSNGHDQERLWRGGRLLAGEDLADKRDSALTETARTFLLAGRVRERRERRVATALVTTVVAALGAAAVYASVQASAARSAASIAEKQRSEAAAQTRAATLALARMARERGRGLAIDGDNAGALPLLLAAYRDEPDDPATRYLLGRAERAVPSRKALLGGHDGRVDSIAMSPGGGRVITGGDDGRVVVWDASRATRLKTLEGHHAPVWLVAFDPQGERIVSADQHNEVRVWSSDGALLTQTRTDRLLTDASLSPDGRTLLVASSSGKVTLWSVDESAPRSVLEGDTGPVARALFSEDARQVVTADDQGRVVVWDAATATKKLAIEPKMGPLAEIGLAKDEVRVVAETGTETRYDARSGKLLSRWEPKKRTSGSRASLRRAFASAGAASIDEVGVARVSGPPQEIVRWRSDVRQGDTMQPVPGTDLVCEGDVLWEARTGLAIPFEHDSVASAVDARGDRFAVAWGVAPETDGRVTLLDVSTMRPVSVLQTSEALFSVTLSADGQLVATGGQEGTVRLWRDTGEPVFVLHPTGPKEAESAVRAILITPDGSGVISTSGNVAVRWSAADGARMASFEGHTAAIASATLSPDGSRLLTASADDTARLWDTETGQSVAALVGHAEAVVDAQFSPDGRVVATASADGTARLWDASDGRVRGVLRPEAGHDEGSLFVVRFDPGGARIATGGAGATVRMWDARDGALLLRAKLGGPGEWVAGLTFDSTGEYLLATLTDGAVVALDVREEKRPFEDVARTVESLIESNAGKGPP
jgi:WD40 repeat protein/serine/threonine protein kinase